MKITWCQRSGDRQLAEQGGDWQITCWFERKWARGVVWKGMTSGTEKESTDLSEIACWFVSWRALISNGIQSSKRALASFPGIDLDYAQSLIHYWPYICVGPTTFFFFSFFSLLIQWSRLEFVRFVLRGWFASNMFSKKLSFDSYS